MPGWKEAIKEMLVGMGGFIGIAVVLVAWYWLSSEIITVTEFYR